MKFTYEILEHVGVISERDEWRREVNIVAWNGGAAKVDIREWNDDHTKMSKGITLTEEQAETLAAILGRRYK